MGVVTRAALFLLGMCCVASADGFGVDDQTASQLQPFHGQGQAPTDVRTNIYVSVAVEKLTNVDDTNFLFEGVFRYVGIALQQNWTSAMGSGILHRNQ